MFASILGLLAADYRKPRAGRTYKPNGEREMARRRRQGAAARQLFSHLTFCVDLEGEACDLRTTGVWPRHLGPKENFITAGPFYDVRPSVKVGWGNVSIPGAS